MWTKAKQLAAGLDALRKQLRDISARLESVESAPTAVDRVLNLEELGVAQDAQLSDLQTKFKDLLFAVETGIERVDRAERRVRGVIQRAKKELAARGYEDPGLEAEDHELRAVDGDGSHGTEVLTLPEEVAEVEPAPSSIRGVSADLLRRRWGIK